MLGRLFVLYGYLLIGLWVLDADLMPRFLRLIDALIMLLYFGSHNADVLHQQRGVDAGILEYYWLSDANIMFRNSHTHAYTHILNILYRVHLDTYIIISLEEA